MMGDSLFAPCFAPNDATSSPEKRLLPLEYTVVDPPGTNRKHLLLDSISPLKSLTLALSMDVRRTRHPRVWRVLCLRVSVQLNGQARKFIVFP